MIRLLLCSVMDRHQRGTDDRCIHCGIGLGLPVTRQTITMPPVLPPRPPSFTRQPPTVADLERTQEAEEIRQRHTRRDVHHGQDRLALSVTITERDDGSIETHHIHNGNERAAKLSAAIADTICDRERWNP